VTRDRPAVDSEGKVVLRPVERLFVWVVLTATRALVFLRELRGAGPGCGGTRLIVRTMLIRFAPKGGE